VKPRRRAIALACLVPLCLSACGDPGTIISIVNQSDLCLRATYLLAEPGQTFGAPVNDSPLYVWDVVPPGQAGEILNTLGSATSRVVIERPDGSPVGSIDDPSDAGSFVVTIAPDLSLSVRELGRDEGPVTDRTFRPSRPCTDGAPASTPRESGPIR
jgi:hypothetical protein